MTKTKNTYWRLSLHPINCRFLSTFSIWHCYNVLYVCAMSLVYSNHVFVPSILYRANYAFFPSSQRRFLRKIACCVVTVIHMKIRMFWISPTHNDVYVHVSTWIILETCLVDHVFVVLYENYSVKHTDVPLKWTVNVFKPFKLRFSNFNAIIFVRILLQVYKNELKSIRSKSWRPESPTYTLLSKNVFVN